MKLWQKLMPVATAAATVACVVPMASCGDSYLVSTSNKDFKPDQHAAVTAGYTQAEATEEYFKDLKNGANDVCYWEALEAKNAETQGKKDYKNYENSFFSGVTLTLGEKKTGVKINDTLTVTGYMVSGKIISNGKVYYESKLESEESKKLYSKIAYSTTANDELTITNGFIFLAPNNALEDTPWSIYLYGIKSLNANWKATNSVSGTNSTTYTYLNGAVDSTTTNGGEVNTLQGEYLENPTAIIPGTYGIPSYVFANVKVKA